MSLSFSRMEQQKQIYQSDALNSYREANLKREESLNSNKSYSSSMSALSRIEEDSSIKKSGYSINNRIAQMGQGNNNKYQIGEIRSNISSEQLQQSNSHQFQIIENTYVSKKTNDSEQEKMYHLNIDQHSKNLQVSSNFDLGSKYKRNSECASRVSMRSNRSQPKSIAKSQKSGIIKDFNSNIPSNKIQNKQQTQVPTDQLKLNMLFKVKSKFRQFFARHTYSGRSKQAGFQRMRMFMKDKSDGDSGEKYNIFLSLFTSLRQHLQSLYLCYKRSFLSKIQTFHPQSNWYLWLTGMFCISNYLFFYVLSLILFFMINNEADVFAGLMYTVIAVQWLIEVLIKLNTGIFQQTSYISSRKQIIPIYLKSRFIFDLIPILSIMVKTSDIYMFYILKSLLFLKVVNVWGDHMNIEKFLIVKMRHFYVLQMINLVSKMFLIGHIISCMYYSVALIDLKYFIQEETSWLSDEMIADKVWWKIYIKSIYWTFTLMITGSNEAISILELFFTVVIMLIMCIVYGYMLNTIGVILAEMNKFDQNQRRDINTINTYMQRKNTSIMVNLDLENYYLRSIKQKSTEELSVLEKISTDLNDSLKLEYNKNIISKIKYLVDNFSQESIEQISLKAEEVYYSPDSIIFGEDDTNNSSLMFIVDGKVGIFQKYKKSEVKHTRIKFLSVDWSKKQKRDQDQKLLCTLGSGTSFGELNFFTGMARQASAISQDFTTILQIDRQDFIDIVKKNEKDFEIFCDFRDRIILYNDFKPVNKKCNICGNSFHLENHCPQVHFDKSNPYIYMRFQYSEPQERNLDLYDRYKRKRTYNAFELQSQEIDAAEQIWELLENERQSEKESNKKNGSLSDNDDDDEDSEKDNASQNKESQFYYFENEPRRDEYSAISSEFQMNQYQENYHQSKLTADETSKNFIDDQQAPTKQMSKVQQNNSLVPQRSSVKRVSANQQLIEKSKTILAIQNPELFKQPKINENIMWYFEQMKAFTHYFPDGNYQNRISRFNIQKNRYLKKKYGRNIFNERQRTNHKSEKLIIKNKNDLDNSRN